MRTHKLRSYANSISLVFSNIRILVGVLSLVLVIFCSQLVNAQVSLHFTPTDTTINVGDSLRLAVLLDEAVDIRTFEAIVEYDPTYINSITGGSGDLFLNSGFMLWDDFVESEPGRWHSYTVVLGAGDFVSGPGELLFWEVAGIQEGIAAITSIVVRLYDPSANLIDEVTLLDTTISVVDPTAVSEIPVFQTGLKLQPNPFNPRTQIEFNLEEPSSARVEVFDLRGCRITTLHDRWTDTGPVTVAWNGKDNHGTSMPGGTYLFRLTTAETAVQTKGVLLK